MKLGRIETPFPVVLAPMAGITDMPFRVLCKEMGCDWAYTEMVSAKGLQYNNEKTKQLLLSAPEERPCGVQLFGSDPAILADMAKRIEENYAEDVFVIDINMGCPATKITSNGDGSALMKDILRASRIIERVSQAVALPVTVKFRKGWDDEHINAVAFARMAEQSGASALGVHGRTRAQGYSGTADWNIIGEVKAAVRIPVLGNGDVYTAKDALALYKHTACDGVLVARGAQGNPFVFREIKSALCGAQILPPTLDERLDMALRHARMQVNYKDRHGVIEMRKHIAWYIKGYPHAAKNRARVNACNTLEDLVALLSEFRKILGDS